MTKHQSPNEYQLRANSTRERRRAQGKYPTVMQEAAARKMISYGIKSLSAVELEHLSKHPHFTGGQRSEYAILAKLAAESMVQS